MSIDAVKRTRGDRASWPSVEIVVEERAGRVDVRAGATRPGRGGAATRASVDFTVTVPAVSVGRRPLGLRVGEGDRRARRRPRRVGERQRARPPTRRTSNTPRACPATSRSLAPRPRAICRPAASAATSPRKGLKARGLDLGSVSGEVILTDVTCERLTIKTVSGNVEYAGAIARNGRYEINTHSGTVRLALANPSGFELNANSFSGSIRSDLPLTIGGDSARDRDSSRGRRGGNDSHTMHATFGDGSATLEVHTFSGDIASSPSGRSIANYLSRGERPLGIPPIVCIIGAGSRAAVGPESPTRQPRGVDANLEAGMKRLVLVGALVGAVAASPAFAQTAEKPAGKASQGAGHAAPKTQPATETAAAAPAGQVALGSVRTPKAIKA